MSRISTGRSESGSGTPAGRTSPPIGPMLPIRSPGPRRSRSPFCRSPTLSGDPEQEYFSDRHHRFVEDCRPIGDLAQLELHLQGTLSRRPCRRPRSRRCLASARPVRRSNSRKLASYGQSNSIPITREPSQLLVLRTCSTTKTGWSDDPDGSLPLAERYAEQAIEKNPNEPLVGPMVCRNERRRLFWPCPAVPSHQAA